MVHKVEFEVRLLKKLANHSSIPEESIMEEYLGPFFLTKVTKKMVATCSDLITTSVFKMAVSSDFMSYMLFPHADIIWGPDQGDCDFLTFKYGKKVEVDLYPFRYRGKEKITTSWKSLCTLITNLSTDYDKQ